MKWIEDLKIKIFSDSASIEDIKMLGELKYIKGFTTNPSLLRKAGVVNYELFIKEALSLIQDKPISFEVISDDFDQMKKQAVKLSNFGSNVYVKIPVMNTRGISSANLISDLLALDVKVNVTAVMTLKQIEDLAKVLKRKKPVIISIFAGRIADTGIDPVPIIKKAREILKGLENVELLWASPRELLNIFQAEEAGCDIITILPEFLKKIHLVSYDLHNFSLDTIKMFFNDAVSSNLTI